MREIKETKLIKANGEIINLGFGKPSLEQLQGYVGGLIEVVPTIDKGSLLIVNEEGIPLGLQINRTASYLVNQQIVGDAVFIDEENFD